MASGTQPLAHGTDDAGGIVRVVSGRLRPAGGGVSEIMASEIMVSEIMASEIEVADFVDLVVARVVAHVIVDDREGLRSIAARVVAEHGRPVLLNDVLLPAARRLGVMWERDECDFMAVTLGVYLLDLIMKETVSEGEVLASRHDRRALLLPAPGEQHRFGCEMVADGFRQDGWCVTAGPAVSRAELVELVRAEWFDVIGLSVTSARWLRGLPACLRAVRGASTNAAPYVMVGGYAIGPHAERARFLGADAIAVSAEEALRQANSFVAARRVLPSYVAHHVDAG